MWLKPTIIDKRRIVIKILGGMDRRCTSREWPCCSFSYCLCNLDYCYASRTTSMCKSFLCAVESIRLAFHDCIHATSDNLQLYSSFPLLRHWYWLDQKRGSRVEVCDWTIQGLYWLTVLKNMAICWAFSSLKDWGIWGKTQALQLNFSSLSLDLLNLTHIKGSYWPWKME